MIENFLGVDQSNEVPSRVHEEANNVTQYGNPYQLPDIDLENDESVTISKGYAYFVSQQHGRYPAFCRVKINDAECNDRNLASEANGDGAKREDGQLDMFVQGAVETLVDQNYLAERFGFTEVR